MKIHNILLRKNEKEKYSENSLKNIFNFKIFRINIGIIEVQTD